LCVVQGLVLAAPPPPLTAGGCFLRSRRQRTPTRRPLARDVLGESARSLLQLPLRAAPRSSTSSPPSPSPRSRGRRRRRVHSPPRARCPLAKQVSTRYLHRSPALLSRSSSYLSAPLPAAPLCPHGPRRPRRAKGAGDVFARPKGRATRSRTVREAEQLRRRCRSRAPFERFWALPMICANAICDCSGTERAGTVQAARAVDHARPRMISLENRTR
jgi:hypothetical protein